MRVKGADGRARARGAQGGLRSAHLARKEQRAGDKRDQGAWWKLSTRKTECGGRDRPAGGGLLPGERQPPARAALGALSKDGEGVWKGKGGRAVNAWREKGQAFDEWGVLTSAAAQLRLVTSASHRALGRGRGRGDIDDARASAVAKEEREGR